MRRAQRGQDRPRCRRAVQRVEVDSGRAARQEIGALEGRVGDPELCNRFRVVGAPVELPLEVLRDRGAAHLGEALDLAVVRDRHDPRDDRHVDAGRARLLDVVEVELVVEEELGDQEARRRPRPSPSRSGGRWRGRARRGGSRGSRRRRRRSRSARGSAGSARRSRRARPGAAVHSVSPRGGSPRRASTFSIPAAWISLEDLARAARAARRRRRGAPSPRCRGRCLIDLVISTVRLRVVPPAP